MTGIGSILVCIIAGVCGGTFSIRISVEEAFFGRRIVRKTGMVWLWLLFFFDSLHVYSDMD